MKVCILSHARCRSTVLSGAFANVFDLHHKQEQYSELKNFSYKERLQIRRSHNKSELTLSIYKDKIMKFTDELFTNDNFVIKVWPRFFNSSKFCFDTEYFIPNLNKFFKFSQYDKIIVSSRNPVDAVCSLSLGVKYGYNHPDKKIADHITKKKYNNYDNNTVVLHPYNKSFLAEIFLIENIKNFLKVNHIPFTFVEFTEIPKYLNDNLPNYEVYKSFPIPLESKIDYKNAVPNYDDLYKEIEEYRETIVPELNKVVF